MHINDLINLARLATAGMSHNNIAAQLGVSKSTVQRHLDNLKLLGLELAQASLISTTKLQELFSIDSGVRPRTHGLWILSTRTVFDSRGWLIKVRFGDTLRVHPTIKRVSPYLHKTTQRERGDL